MKVIINSENEFILFFNALNSINIDDINEDNFKDIFLKLKKNYNINIYGFYNIEVFINKYYVSIIKITKDNDLDLFYKQVDMHIIIYKNSVFLYKVNDYFFINNLDNFNIYYYNDFFYLEIIKNITNKEMLYLIENSLVIFEDVDKIKSNCKKICP